MNDHELGFLAFIQPPQQRRLKALLELGEKRRQEVRSLLDHAITLDPKTVRNLPGGDQSPRIVEKKLRALGAPDSCYIIGPASVDGRTMPLGEALDAIMHQGNGAFLSCLPGKLGYYEYEHANGGQILHR
jgi:hypothetical protein